MDPDEQLVAYAEFLALARDEGLVGLEVLVVQAPHDANGRSAVVLATARTAHGGFSAIGEASPMSAPPNWHPFLATLAELRAKARALREMTGLEHALEEELAVPYARGETPPERQPAPTRQTPAAMAAVRTGMDRSGDVGVARLPTAAPRVVTAAGRDDSADTDEPDEPAEGDDDADGPPPPVADAPTVAPAAVSAMPADEPEPGFEGVGRDMEEKLLKLAMSIAALENDDITETEARQKLDLFFVRAFKHPLGRATRMEGQRVVQRLSGDLVRLRQQSTAEKE